MILVYGKGGHSRVITDTLEDLKLSYQTFDDADAQVEPHPMSPFLKFIVAIGDNRIRESRFDMLVAYGFKPTNVIHPTAFISHRAQLGKGIFVAAGVKINSHAKIGTGAIVNTNCNIDHDCSIGEFSHVAPGVALCGGVKVGTGTLLSVGSSVIPNINIGSYSVVASGASVIHDVPDGVLVAGVPAKIKKVYFNENRY